MLDTKALEDDESACKYMLPAGVISGAVSSKNERVITITLICIQEYKEQVLTRKPRENKTKYTLDPEIHFLMKTNK